MRSGISGIGKPISASEEKQRKTGGGALVGLWKSRVKHSLSFLFSLFFRVRAGLGRIG